MNDVVRGRIRVGRGHFSSWVALLVTLLAVWLALNGLAGPVKPIQVKWQNVSDLAVQTPAETWSYLPSYRDGKRDLIINYNLASNKYEAVKISTEAFALPRYLSVAVQGKTNLQDVGSGTLRSSAATIALLCEESDKRIELLLDRSEEFVEKVIEVPVGWCSGGGRLIAEAYDDEITVGIGSPYQVSRLRYLMSSQVGALLAFGVIALTLYGLSFIATLFLGRSVHLSAVPASFLLFAISWLSFWFVVIGISPLLSMGVVLPFLAFRKAKIDGDTCNGNFQGFTTWSIGTIRVQFFISTALALLLVSKGAAFNAWVPNYIFYPVRWANDNQISAVVADFVYEGKGLVPAYIGSYSITDRGIVIAGLYIFVRSIFSLLGLYGDSAIRSFFYLSTSVFVSSFSISQIYAFFRQYFSVARCILVVVIIISTPTTLFNVIYTWPKMPAAFFSVVALCLLFGKGDETKNYRYLIAGILVSLSASLHPSSLLAVPMFIFFVAFAKNCNESAWNLSVRSVLLFGTGLLVGIVPMLISNALHATSSFGAKYLLTGKLDLIDRSSTWSYLYEFFSGHSITFFLNRWLLQVKTLFYPFDYIEYFSLPTSDFVDKFRLWMEFSFVGGLGPIILSLPYLYIIRKKIPAKFFLLFSALIFNLIVLTIVMGAPVVSHHLPLVLHIGLLMVMLASLAKRGGGAIIGFAFAQVCFTVCFWLI